MDKLVATLIGACTSVKAVHVSRVVDAARRRESFQRKIAAGLSPAEFEERRRGGRVGHVGLAESAHMLADVIGIGAERTVEESLRPVLAERSLATDYLAVAPGQVAGIEQHVLIESGTRRVRLDLQMYVGAARPQDTVSIDGSPSLEMAVGSGVPGDEATAAVVVNCVPLLSGLEPGLRTMLDVPLRFMPIRGQVFKT